jgi:hypothetical protein
MIQFFHRPYVRPWALTAPIIILIVSLPLLRPLRNPTELSMQEATRLAAVQSLVEHHQLAPAAANLPPGEPAMPVFTVLLAGPYWVLYHLGYRLSRDTAMVSYLLTLLCATIPAAATPGLIYRMGRIFQLPRPARFGLSLGVVLCSGLISYATVLNPYAPSAFLVLASAACLIHSAVVPRRSRAAIALAGFFAATAAVIDLSAVPFLILLPLALLTMRESALWRAGAILFFVLGTFPPLLLHRVLSADLPREPPMAQMTSANASAAPDTDDDQEEEQPSVFLVTGLGIGRVLEALLGSHGLLSHFPAFVLAGLGIGTLMHRHWPGVIKALALLSLCGAAVVIGWVAATGPGNPMLMYANRYYIPFSPLLLFWAGAWLRREHRPATWCAAGILIAVSGAVGLIGAINPCPPNGFNQYTPVAVIQGMLKK